MVSQTFAGIRRSRQQGFRCFTGSLCIPTERREEGLSFQGRKSKTNMLVTRFYAPETLRGPDFDLVSWQQSLSQARTLLANLTSLS